MVGVGKFLGQGPSRVSRADKHHIFYSIGMEHMAEPPLGRQIQPV